MNYDYSKRDCLLPAGCKDLIDVCKLEAQKKALGPQTPKAAPLPPIIDELGIPEHITVSELASLLKRKPFGVIADLMELGVFANVNDKLDFDSVAKVARRHGYTAKREAQ